MKRIITDKLTLTVPESTIYRITFAKLLGRPNDTASLSIAKDGVAMRTMSLKSQTSEFECPANCHAFPGDVISVVMLNSSNQSLLLEVEEL